MAERSGADQFVAGKPVVYVGFDSALYIARYFNGERNGLGVGHLEITKARCGSLIADPLMAECRARTFFWNLDAQAEK